MEQPSLSPAIRTSFIRVIEVWTPDDTGQRLHLRDAHYGDLMEFQELSLNTSFACGEGLPGRAWQEQRPVVLREFDASNFLRTDAAHAAGLTSGVAIPIFAGDTFKAVLVMLCGETGSATGAIEVWQDDGLSGMAWVDGYYGDMQRFEWLSRLIKFPAGVGLPGGVWKTATPQIIGDLPRSTSFLRAANARDAGISTGIGIPFYSPASKTDMSAVLTFLSANKTPIARRFEVWETTETGDELYFVSGIDQERDQIEAADEDRRVAVGTWAIGRALAEGVPVIDEAEGYGVLLAVPVWRLDGSGVVVVFCQ